MNIVMLGHSGVGKTTYMASMYGRLQKPIKGFRLKAQDTGSHEYLLQLAADIRKGIYPMATDQRASYRFQLEYEGESVLPFTWVDYRGGALRETQNSPGANQLVKDLQAADGILLFCDSATLKKGRSLKSEIGRMIMLASRALESVDRLLPLVIALTKYDLVGSISGDVRSVVMSMDDVMLEPFMGMIEAVGASENVQGTIIPISCGQKPINVQLPVLFALYIGIAMKGATLEEQFEGEMARAELYKNNAGWWDNFVSVLKQEPSFGEMAQKQYALAGKTYLETQKIIKPATALLEYLEHLPSF